MSFKVRPSVFSAGRQNFSREPVQFGVADFYGFPTLPGRMSTSESYLINVNKRQKGAETDLFTPQRYRQFFRALPNGGKKVLDLGCATGRGGAVLKSLNPSLDITGLDCLQDRLDELDRNIYSETLCGFTSNIPEADRTYDAVVAGEFLEHVPPSQVDATLSEVFRVLKLRGVFLLTTPNPGYLKNKFLGLSVLIDTAHVTQHYPYILRTRLRQVGFSSVRIRGCGKVSNYVGTRFPWLAVYGSYFVSATKW